MDENKQRREAEKKFKLSLSALEAVWKAEEAAAAANTPPPKPAEVEEPPPSDWESALADAADDIEQFMAQRPPQDPPEGP
jgi:hypothetical protein